MGHNLAILKLYCVALLVLCGSCRTKIEPKQLTGIDSIESPKPVEVCNGLGIALHISPLKYHVGDEYKLEVVFTNLSREDITIWVPFNKIDIVITDDNWDGKTITYTVPQIVTSHNMFESEAWQQDIFRLKPDESRIFNRNMGHNVPGKMRLVVRYSNSKKEITMERYLGRDKDYKPEIPMVSNKQLVSVWTGTLISTPVTIEFVED